jgi:cytoskeletal protein CcmA (bactofilin family)
MNIGHMPNEDSQSLVFDDTNLFSVSKFSGYDRVEGCVRAERIVIGDTGAVQGELLAARAEIHGVVMGSVAARDVALCVGSHVEADILQRTFSVASGARFTGRCSHGEMPASPVASVIKEVNRLVSLSEQTLAEVVGG